ncbi:MAG: XrtA system polysaccharide chain length determinant [Pseudomonadota bacterium]
MSGRSSFELSDLPNPVLRFASGLWRRRWIIIAVAWAFCLLGWLAVWLLPDRYESRAHVFVQTETILEPVLVGIMARPDYSRRVEVMQQQLLTRPNIEDVIDRTGLGQTIRGRSDIERRRNLQALSQEIADDIRIDSPQDMYFVISYKHRDPVIARDVVDAVLNMLIEQDLGASLSENQAARVRLDRQIAEYKDRLNEQDRELANFQRINADSLSIAQNTVRLRAQKESELVRIQEELQGTERQILTFQSLLAATPRSNSQTELDQLRLRLADLRSQYNENHPDIVGILARISEIEASGGETSTSQEYRRLAAQLIAAQNSVTSIKDREERVRRELEELAYAANQAPAAQVELQRITRDYEQTQKTYVDLISRRDRLSLTESLGAAGRGVEYQVFERPQTALAPSEPPRLLLIFGVLVFATMAGVGSAFVLTVFEKTYSQAEDLGHAFGIPVLGSISETPSKANRLARRSDILRMGVAMAGLVTVALVYIYATVSHTPQSRVGAATTAMFPSVVEGS